jgi:hypothetical protein
MRFRYKVPLVNAVCPENHKICINKLCGQNEEILNVQVSGTYIYHCAKNVNAM